MKSLALALDEEFKRVAKNEDVPMGDLVAGVAELLGCTDRMIYNYRSGKWPLPSSYVPVLCKRFKSTLLFNVLAAAVTEADQASPIIDDADLNEISVRDQAKNLLIASLGHFSLIEDALKKAGGVTKNDVLEIEESSQRMALKFRYVLALVDALYESHAALRRRQA